MPKSRTILASQLNNHKTWAHRLSAVAIVALALVLRLNSFQGWSDSDPRVYTIRAYDLAQGPIHLPTYPKPSLFSLRIGVNAPASVFIRLFGFSKITIVAYPFLISICALLMGYAFARTLISPLAGLICLFLLSIIPLDLTQSSLLLPDLIAAFWGNAAVVLAFLCLREKNKPQTALLAIAAGVLLGMSWLCKATVVYLGPFILLIFIFPIVPSDNKSRWRKLCFLAIGAFAVFAIETCFLYYRTGDILFRFHTTERNYERHAVWFFSWESGHYLRTVLIRLFWTGPKIMLWSSELGRIPAFGLLGAVWVIMHRRRQLLFPAIWLVSLLLLFNFGSASLTSYQPLRLFSRYLYPLLLPSCLLIAGLISFPFTPAIKSELGRKRRFWALAVLACVSVCSLQGLPSQIRKKSEYPERITASRVQEDDIVFSDYRSTRSLAFLRAGVLGTHAFTKPYEGLSAQEIPAGSYVLIDRHMTRFLERAYKYVRAPFEDDPPETWAEVWSSEDASLYKVAKP